MHGVLPDEWSTGPPPLINRAEYRSGYAFSKATHRSRKWSLSLFISIFKSWSTGSFLSSYFFSPCPLFLFFPFPSPLLLSLLLSSSFLSSPPFFFPCSPPSLCFGSIAILCSSVADELTDRLFFLRSTSQNEPRYAKTGLASLVGFRQNNHGMGWHGTPIFIANTKRHKKPYLLPKAVDCTKQRCIFPAYLRLLTSSISPLFPSKTYPNIFEFSDESFIAQDALSTAMKTIVTLSPFLSYTVSSAMSRQFSSCCLVSINFPYNDHVRWNRAGFLKDTPNSSMGVPMGRERNAK